MRHVLYLTDTLNSGGAERQLTEFALRLDGTQVEPKVFYYATGDFFSPVLREAGVQVMYVPRRGRFDLGPVFAVRDMLGRGEVDVIHAWADMPNLYAVLAAKLAGRGKVIAGVRSANDMGRGRLAWLLKTWAHRQADVTISNNVAGLERVKRKAGLTDEAIICVRNGIDMEHFSPVDEAVRERLRAKLGAGPGDVLFLSVGTLYWRKNYRGYIDALAAMDVPPNWRFVWVGRSPDEELIGHIEAVLKGRGLEGQFRLMTEPVDDVRPLYRAADVLVSNSLSEGTPNVVIEALACEVPVLVTDVGDSAVFAAGGEAGWVIPPDDNGALAAALRAAAAVEGGVRREMGRRGRALLFELGMDMESVVQFHHDLYLSL